MSNMPSKLRILHLILGLTETNGQYNEHCLPMTQKRDLTICTYYTPDKKPPAAIKLFAGNNTIWGFCQAFRAAINAQEYDVIHAHVPNTGVMVLLAIFLFGLYRRVIPYSVYTVQNSFQNYKFRNRLLMLPIFMFFRKIVFCSHACQESFPFFMRWLVGKRSFVVPNAVDLDRVDRIVANLEKTQRSEQFTIASVGRLIPIKNPFTLLKAFQQAGDDGKLVFIGEGSLRPELTAEVVQQGLEERVQFTGLVPRDEVFRRVSQADLYVSTSRGEGLPVAVIEVMACQRPVILSDIPPHREIARGVDFIPIVHEDDVAGFAREIARMRAMSPTERAELGAKCRQLVQDRFSLTAMHNQLEAIYRQLPRRQPPTYPGHGQPALR